MQFIFIYVSEYFWGLMGAAGASLQGVGLKPLMRRDREWPA